MRSLLILPPVELQAATGALMSGADALILDLAAAPDEHRVAAREAIARVLDARPRERGNCRIFVRIGALSSGFADADLDAVAPCRPDGILLPEAIGGRDVQHLAAKLALREAESGLADGAIPIIVAPAAKAAGLFELSTLRGASARLIGLLWEPETLARDIGAETPFDGEGRLTRPYDVARSLVLFAAAAAGVPPIDAAFRGTDPAPLEAECREAVRDGFSGKLARSPTEIATINTVFDTAVRQRIR